MRKKVFFSLVLILQLFGSSLWASPQFSGVIRKLDQSTRLVLLRFESGQSQRFFISPQAEIKRANQPVDLSQFKVGDEVVLKVSGGLNEDPIVASGLFDKLNAPPSDVANIYPMGTNIGGFATVGGPAGNVPTSPNILQKVAFGDQNAFTPSQGGLSTDMLGGGLSAAPSPMSSPALGGAISPPKGFGDLMGLPGGEKTQSMTLPGSEPDPDEENQTQEQEPADKPVYKTDLYGQLLKIDGQNKVLYVMISGENQMLMVKIFPQTVCTDFTSGKIIKIGEFSPGDSLQLVGVLTGQILEAKFVVVRQKAPRK